MIENLDVLPRGMQHLDDVGPLQQLVERRQVDARRQGIDDRLRACRRARHLDQAKLGIIGLVAQEFGVQRQIGRASKLGDQGRRGPHVVSTIRIGTVIADSTARGRKFARCGYHCAVSPTVRPGNPAASK